MEQRYISHLSTVHYHTEFEMKKCAYYSGIAVIFLHTLTAQQNQKAGMTSPLNSQLGDKFHTTGIQFKKRQHKPINSAVTVKVSHVNMHPVSDMSNMVPKT